MNRWIGIVASVLIAAVLVLLLYVGPATGGVEQFRTKLLSYGPWSVVVSAGLMIAQAIIAPLPANVVTITNGLVFGPLWGALLSWVSTLVGASLCFTLSRTFGKPFALKIVGKPLDNAERFFRKYGLHAMFLVRIVPFVPFDAISYGAGLIGVPYLTFLTATAIGIIPSILAYSYLGSVVAGWYWYLLTGVLTFSLIGTILAILLIRKPKDAPFAPTRIPDTL